MRPDRVLLSLPGPEGRSTKISILRWPNSTCLTSAPELKLERPPLSGDGSCWPTSIPPVVPQPTARRTSPARSDRCVSGSGDWNRCVGARLQTQPQVGRDVFRRGAPEPIQVDRKSFQSRLFDLLAAYGQHLSRRTRSSIRSNPSCCIRSKAALERLSQMIGRLPVWTCGRNSCRLRSDRVPAVSSGALSAAQRSRHIRRELELGQARLSISGRNAVSSRSIFALPATDWHRVTADDFIPSA